MRAIAALAVLAAACAFPAAASAHGDPVSDGLRAGNLFLPFDPNVSQAARRSLQAAVDDANRSGYAVRVAVVASSYDVGALRVLWRKPRALAGYVGTDLRDDGVYRQRVVVVMPNGFGIFWTGHDAAPLYRVLGRIRTTGAAAALVGAAQTAVVRLAALEGVKVDTARAGSSYRRQRVLILAAVAAVLVGGTAVRLALRRRETA